MWYVWSINQQRIKFIREYIAKFFGDSVEVFYPTKVSASFRKGKKVKVRSLLYGGYIFLRYDNDTNIHNRLKAIKGIQYCIGECSNGYVDALKEKEGWNAEDRSVTVGDCVEVMCGPLSGQKGIIKEIIGTSATISLSFFNRRIDCSIPVDDLEIVDKSTK